MAADPSAARPVRHRPRTGTVFVAAFVAGAVAAVGVNRALDVRLAQARPQVECEPVFVALRALPAGAAVTVWDVALRDLPKAMVPATALRVSDSFEGRLLKFPLREGQPLISAQLIQPEVAAPIVPETPTGEPAAEESLVEEAFVPPVPAAPVAVEVGAPMTDARDTVTSRPLVDEPVPSLSNHAPAETGLAIAAGDEDDTEPVASVAETPEVDVTTETPESEIAQAPRVAVSESTPVVAVEPTPAAPTPAATAPAVSLSSDLFAIPRAADLDASLDMPSRPAADIADLPSVMASGEADAGRSATASGGSGVRYLVVPERIARQVDTAFTTPAAPEATAPVKAAAQPDRGPAATKQQQVRPQPAKSGTTPGQPARPGKPVQSVRPVQSGQPTATVPQPSGPRAWGGMFPNVAAGLEAMGGWRSGNRPAPDQADRSSSTR
jgi:hypothetical protein